MNPFLNLILFQLLEPKKDLVHNLMHLLLWDFIWKENSELLVANSDCNDSLFTKDIDSYLASLLVTRLFP